MRPLLLALLLCLSLAAQGPKVVFLSLDGLGADQVTADTMPRLWALSREGWTGRSRPPFPSTTFNGHATLATGCEPRHHGILGNSFEDPVSGYHPHTALARFLEREPLWIAATRSGVRSAVYHWPFADAPWRGQEPWRREGFKAGDGDQAALTFVAKALSDGAGLVMAYLPGTDAEAHFHGPQSPSNRVRMKAIDDLLAPWIQAQRSQYPGIRILVTADHGMTAMTQRISLPDLLQGFQGRWIAHGSSATLTLRNQAQRPDVLARLKAAGLTAWPSAEGPESMRHPRAGDILVQAPAGTWLSTGANALAVAMEAKGRQGAHGAMIDLPNLHAFTLILGAGRGDLGEFSMTRLAPTLAAWMGVHWAQEPDGKPLDLR